MIIPANEEEEEDDNSGLSSYCSDHGKAGSAEGQHTMRGKHKCLNKNSERIKSTRKNESREKYTQLALGHN